LIEVLVAVLVLSFGVLALGGMLAYAVQMPKLAGYRATAAQLASSHIESIRANPAGWAAGHYVAAGLSFDNTFDETALAPCTYPACSPAALAARDVAYTNLAARQDLPAGGTLTTCDPAPCTSESFGNVWVIWQEPANGTPITAGDSDNCPTAVTSLKLAPAPRCLYMRFMP
jgi:type IV pilus assembly protein PilV